MLGYVASTSTGTGLTLAVDPPATAFGVQWDGESTAVNYLLKGSINGTNFVNLHAASTGRTGECIAVNSTQGPMTHIQISCTLNGSTTALAAHITAFGADLKRTT